MPFGYLFLKEPPKEELPIPFFRTTNPLKKVSLNVFDTILLLKKRQEWLKEYLEEIESEDLDFVGKFNTQTSYNLIVNDIRKILNLTDDWASKFKDFDKALNHLTEKIEELGIIVVFNSVVENNTHRKIEVTECRGFVLVDKKAPFMFINSSDSKSAQIFTIIHELAHIWIGQSAGFDFDNFLPSNDPIELLCDRVAAEFLVPQNLFYRLWRKTRNFNELSKFFKVSPIVVARRALDLKEINKAYFFKFYQKYVSFKNIKAKSRGGDFYATAKKRIGMAFASHIINAVKSNKLLYRDAYKLTGLSGDSFDTFFNNYFYN